MERYVVRHEFFGGLVYDRQEDTNILIDEDFYQALSYLRNIPQEQIIQIIGDEDAAFFQEEGFLENNRPNYRLIDSGHIYAICFDAYLRCSAIFPVDALLSAAGPLHPVAEASRRWPYKSGAALPRHAPWKALHNRASSARANQNTPLAGS